MICAQCGTNVPDGRKFCENCGAPLQQVGAQPAGLTGQASQVPPEQKHESGRPVGGKPQARYASERQNAQQANAPTPQGVQPSAPMSAPGGQAFPTGPMQPSAAGQGQAAAGKRGRSGGIIGLVVLIVAALILISTCNSLFDGAGSHSGGGGGGGAAGGAAVTNEGTAPAVSEADAAKSNDTWTVLFYLCGSDLESDGGMATYNLQELSQANLGDKVNFVVEAGGAKKWHNRAFDARYLTRAVADGSDFTVVDRQPTAPMGDAGTLADFVAWGAQNYPADHYMLILWDHGGGSVLGVCNDELFPGPSSTFSESLTIAEMDQALGQAGVQFEVIGFDTCLMATVETATRLAPYANYMVASEETEPGTGWDYTAFPNWLATHTGTDGNLLGRQICDTYYEKCRKYGVASMATLSVTDLSKTDELAHAFLGASGELAQATTSNSSLRALSRGSNASERFGSDKAYNMVDLGNLMTNTSTVVSKYSDDVIAALRQAVVYQVHGRSRQGVSGLSVFYPLDTRYDEMFYRYLEVVGNVPYAQFLSVMYGKYNEIDWSRYSSAVSMKSVPLKEDDVSLKFEQGVNSDGRLELHITDGLDDVSQVNVELSMYLPEQQALVYLGTDHDVSNPENGVYVDDFDGTWLAVDGNWVDAVLLEHGSNYNLYAIPVKLNGDTTNLIAQYDYSTREYSILCACDDSEENGMSAKSMRALEEGDHLEFIFAAHLIRDQETFFFTMGETTWSDSVVMEDRDLGEGAYMFSFKIVDVLNETHSADMYVQSYGSDGKITVQSLEDFLRQ